jgi:hypothetical protein
VWVKLWLRGRWPLLPSLWQGKPHDWLCAPKFLAGLVVNEDEIIVRDGLKTWLRTRPFHVVPTERSEFTSRGHFSSLTSLSG